MPHPLQFPLHEVKETGLQSIEVKVAGQRFPGAVDDGELLGNLTVKGIISKQDDEAAFDGSVSGTWRIECTRCLVPVEGKFSGQVEACGPIDAGPLDISDDVRQAIVLAQPLKMLCRPDCKGLCQVCRKNRNTTDCGHKEEPPSQGRTRLIPRPDKG